MSDQWDPVRRGRSASGLGPVAPDADGSAALRPIASKLATRKMSAPDGSLRSPLAAPPRRNLKQYREDLKSHPMQRMQDKISNDWAATRQDLIKPTLRRAKGRITRRLRDRFIGSRGRASISGSRLTEVGFREIAPAASNLQRATLLRHKDDVLKQFRLFGDGIATAGDVAAADAVDVKTEAAAVNSAVTRLKGSVRELLIIAHAQRTRLAAEAAVAETPAGRDAHKVREELLAKAIDTLVDLDGQLHDIMDRVDAGTNLDDALPALLAGVKQISTMLGAAWLDEPAILKLLADQTGVMTTDTEAQAAHASHTLNEAVRAYDSAPSTDRTRAEAMFSVAVKSGLAEVLQVDCREMLEHAVEQLEEKLTAYRLPGVDPANTRTAFGKDFADLKDLSRQIALKRQFDDLDGQMAAAERALRDADRDRSAFLNGSVTDRRTTLQGLNERRETLLHRKSELQSERSDLEREFGRRRADIDSVDVLAGRFTKASNQVAYEISRRLAQPTSGLFGTLRRQMADRDLKAQLTTISNLARGQKELERVPSQRIGDFRVSRIEIESMRNAWAVAYEVSQRSAASNIWHGIKDGLRRAFTGAVVNNYALAQSKLTSKAVAASLEMDAHFLEQAELRGATDAENGAEREQHGAHLETVEHWATAVDVGEHVIGALGGAYGAYRRANIVQAKGRTRKLGRDLCQQFAEMQADLEDPVARARHKYDNRLQYFCGRYLQDQGMKKAKAEVMISSLATARHAYAAAAPLYHGALTTVAPLAGAAAPGAAAVISGVDLIFASLELHEGRVTREALEEVAARHKDHFDGLCTGAGVDLTAFKDEHGHLDFTSARQSLIDSGEDELAEEIERLAVSKHLVDVVSGKVNIEEKALLVATKTTATLAYGATTVVALSVAGGSLIAAPVSLGLLVGASVAGSVYFGYKANRKNWSDFIKERATDALLGRADPNVIKRISEEAEAENISVDQAVLHHLYAHDDEALARHYLGDLKWRTRHVRPSDAEKERRAQLDARVSQLEEEIEDLKAAADALEAKAPMQPGTRLASLDRDDPRRLYVERRSELNSTNQDLMFLNRELHQRVVDSGIDVVDQLSDGLELPNDVILALVESDESNEDHAVRLLAERIHKLG